jgi:hypothetical protein
MMNYVKEIELNMQQNLREQNLEMVCLLSYFIFVLCYFLLDILSTNIPTSTPTQDNKQLPPLPIMSNEQAHPPTPTNLSKRSNVRKNQYGDEVYD